MFYPIVFMCGLDVHFIVFVSFLLGFNAVQRMNERGEQTTNEKYEMWMAAAIRHDMLQVD